MYTLIFVCVIIVGLLYYRRSSKLKYDDNLPFLNTKNGEWFTRVRARVRNTLNYRDAVHQAYDTYSKKDQSCVISTINGDDIILPLPAINWIINQPDDVLSVDLTHKEQLQTDYTFPHPYVADNPLHHETIRSELTRQLGALTTDIIDELGASFDEIWGMDTNDWKEVCLFETVMAIIARTSNRVFVGLPLCRNQALLDHGMGFASAVPISSVVMRMFPEFLKPLAAVAVTRPNRKHASAFTQILRPEIERRRRLLDGQHGGELEKKVGDPEPNDFLQWTIRRAEISHHPRETDVEIIAARILLLNFAAIHTSTFSITNAIFDLSAANPSMKYFDQLREEVDTVLAADDGVWTKAGLAKMYKADSTLRESTRINSFLGIGLVRRVVDPKGVTAPNGTFCPYNSYICVPTNGVHNDASHYPDTTQYDPLRFSVQRQAPSETVEAQDPTKGLEPPKTTQHKRSTSNTDEYIKKANLSFVSTSPTYHPFGHGRHACPGRFFAANELKLLLAYMVSNYDIEPLETRPPSKWMGTSLVPPLKATIRIRRRK